MVLKINKIMFMPVIRIICVVSGHEVLCPLLSPVFKSQVYPKLKQAPLCYECLYV